MPNGRSTRSAISAGKSRPLTSISNCCTIEVPPPEYWVTVPGGANDSTAGVFAPPEPRNTSARAGIGLPCG